MKKKKAITILLEFVSNKKKFFDRTDHYKVTTPGYIAKLSFLLIIMLSLTTGVYAQSLTDKVSFELKSESLDKGLQKLAKLSGFKISYSADQVSQYKNILVEKQNRNVETTLKLLLAKTILTYEITGSNILIVKKSKEVATNASSTSSFVISGTVNDADNMPLPGVTIRLKKDPNNGATTDADGKYGIEVKNGDVITYSFVGYQTYEQKVGDKNIYNIQLNQNSKLLDEVQVIGYGTTTKRLNTGSISSVKSESILSQPISNPLAALSGRVPGLSIQQQNGLPGSNSTVKIRGVGSMQSGGEPLYVIDGIPFANNNLNNYGIGVANGGISPFSMINSADIESIDVLKDADATAIYGARGANGVILIKTKRGKTGKAKLDVNVYLGTEAVGHFIPMLNLSQYLDLRREAFRNDGVTPDAYNAPDLMVYNTTEYTNWQKELLGGTAHVSDVQATFSGGNEMIKFLVNANFRKEGTVFPGDMGSKRIGSRMNLDYKSVDGKFTATFSGVFSNDNTNLVTSDLTSFYNLPPDYPRYNADGTLFWDNYQNNPMAYLLQKYKGTTNTLLGNTSLCYTPILNLHLKVNFGYTRTALEQKNAMPASSFNPIYNFTSSALFSNTESTNYIIEPTSDYTISSDNWSLNALVGASFQENSSASSVIQASNYSSDALLFSIRAAGMLLGYDDKDEYNFASLFGRLNYNWKKKYILDLNFRRDGSSKFGSNNRFGNFGSAGVAWLFSSESFLKNNISFLSFGKLRGSYGITGNDQISNYIYLPLYQVRDIYDNSSSLILNTFANPNIKWETTQKTEVALDLGFFNDKLRLTTNYYFNRSNNQILSTSLASQSGFSSFQQNLDAVIQNTGFELDLTSSNIDYKNFKWSTSFNVTFPKNKLVSFPGLENSNYKNFYQIGKPIDASLRYQYTGIDPETGKVLYKDSDGDGVPDYEMVDVGTPFYGGVSNTFTYKSWTLNFLFQFSHKKGNTNSLGLYQGAFALGNMSNQNTSVMNRWAQAGNNTLFPGATATPGTELYSSYDFYQFSNVFFGDASFIRFKSFNIEYSVPDRWVKYLKLSRLGVYFQGLNLYTWMKNKYVFDPETEVGTLPPLRTFVLGVNCSF